MTLIDQLNNNSNVDEDILRAVARVVTTLKAMLSASARCQVNTNFEDEIRILRPC